MNESTTLNIGKKTFVSAIVILIVLLIGSGILTQVIPMGSYERLMVDGQSRIVPDSFEYTDGDKLPIIKWVTAPIEVLFAGDGVIIVMIILFLLIIGGSIHILNEANVLKTIIGNVVIKFSNKKYWLMAVIVFIFMSLGAFIGIFEEIIPLVPLIIALSLELGWDKMTGLGMSLLATGFGFSAAVSNPFTIGVAQKIAGLEMFSGAPFRIMIFIITYLVLTSFLIRYAKKIDTSKGIRINTTSFDENSNQSSPKAVKWFVILTLVMVGLILLSPVVPIISQLNLPIIGVIFLMSGVGSGVFSGFSFKKIMNSFAKGALSMAPGIVLILLATGVKHVIQSGGIMDTILYFASGKVLTSAPFTAVIVVYMLVFILNFFIGSGSAKAFLIIPIIVPLMDMMGISRQMAILAFQFGDGFSNILYPTNAVLLIAIGLAGVSYIDWLKWVFKIQLIMGFVSLALLWVGLAIGY